MSVELHVSHYVKMVEELQTENDRLKKEFEEYKAKYPISEVPAPLPAPPVVLSSPKQSHLPPVVAAAVAAINNKVKLPVSTSTVAINTSPCKPLVSMFLFSFEYYDSCILYQVVNLLSFLSFVV